ncbi:Uncharacterised protein [Serratia proteamaculans]|nr:Uncharacterised protein [Serratia proteamaculans]
MRKTRFTEHQNIAVLKPVEARRTNISLLIYNTHISGAKTTTNNGTHFSY